MFGNRAQMQSMINWLNFNIVVSQDAGRNEKTAG